MDFNGLIAVSQGEQRRHEERERRQKAFLEQRLEKIKVEMTGKQPHWLVVLVNVLQNRLLI